MFLCRASMHSFHRLSILERATDHECVNNCNRPKEMWVGFKCNGHIIFSHRRGASKIQHMRFPPSPPPPPPACLTSSPLVLSPPLFPHPPCSIVVGWDISGSGAPAGVFSQRRVVRHYDSANGIFDGSEPWENSAGEQETGDDEQRPLPPPPAPLVSLIRDMETNGGGGGGKAWPTRGPTTLN
jgi:hypothetical protein